MTNHIPSNVHYLRWWLEDDHRDLTLWGAKTRFRSFNWCLGKVLIRLAAVRGRQESVPAWSPPFSYVRTRSFRTEDSSSPHMRPTGRLASRVPPSYVMARFWHPHDLPARSYGHPQDGHAVTTTSDEVTHVTDMRRRPRRSRDQRTCTVQAGCLPSATRDE
jgi:hypothetical protein